jgi:hypothetical protein
MSRPMSSGSKRPRADDFYREDPKRTKPDDCGLRDDRDQDAYGRRDFPERRISEDNRFVRPGEPTPPRKPPGQSPLSMNGQPIPAEPRGRLPSSPQSNKSEYFPASSHAPSGPSSPTGQNLTHNIRPSPPAHIQTTFSDNESIRSGSFDTAASNIAPVASILDRSGMLQSRR